VEAMRRLMASNSVALVYSEAMRRLPAVEAVPVHPSPPHSTGCAPLVCVCALVCLCASTLHRLHTISTLRRLHTDGMQPDRLCHANLAKARRVPAPLDTRGGKPFAAPP
jgi:hypothetical protein